jgi:hypothetical protein
MKDIERSTDERILDILKAIEDIHAGSGTGQLVPWPDVGVAAQLF